MARRLDISEQLRRAIVKALEHEGESYFVLGAAAGVNPAQINRFVNGERDIRLSTAARLADYLELQLTSTRD
jgi:plasmid maintenance system antidote protein VapI